MIVDEASARGSATFFNNTILKAYSPKDSNWDQRLMVHVTFQFYCSKKKILLNKIVDLECVVFRKRNLLRFWHCKQ